MSGSGLTLTSFFALLIVVAGLLFSFLVFRFPILTLRFSFAGLVHGQFFALNDLTLWVEERLHRFM